ncbi:MAG: Na+/H+ antiporter NhaC [Saprospiraceae bacterium]|nr:Na+/H+ antiporter NhaC [Saprospiraceae bacterium]
MAKEKPNTKIGTDISQRGALGMILVFLLTLIVGLFIFPKKTGQEALAIEILVFAAFCMASIYLLFRGHSWESVQASVNEKVKEAVPAMLILSCIGVLIGAWMVSGTIPMLIYYGLQLVSPKFLYVFAFGICILFSLLTGTSWGSAGTIGIVVIGMAQVYGAHLGITAGAIVGGAFFGDKLSPLSDTTNIAALATGVDLFDHIRSMLYTTLPAAAIAAVAYGLLSVDQLSDVAGTRTEQMQNASESIAGMFHFSWWLLLPLGIVIIGAATRKPIVLTLLLSSFMAVLLGAVFQDIKLSDIVASLSTGFSVNMLENSLPDSSITPILNRGGLYSMKEAVIICLLIFAYLGLLQYVDAINRVMRPILAMIKKRTHAVAMTLTTTLITNLFSSNQYATSFIIGTTFKPIYSRLKIRRDVLSRSIEDAGTMMENLAPWTPSGIFMATALGVSTLEYAPWQFLSMANIIIAYFYAFTGIACFFAEAKKET